MPKWSLFQTRKAGSTFKESINVMVHPFNGLKKKCDHINGYLRKSNTHR